MQITETSNEGLKRTLQVVVPAGELDKRFTFLEHRMPHDPIVHELRAEVELVTSRLVELGVVTRGAFVRKSSPQIGGSFGGCARLIA